MKRNANFFALLASLALLASCGDGTPSDTSSAGSGDTPSTSQESTSEAPVTYKVVIRASEGVTVVTDKTEAEKGEKVTLTVSLSEGFSLRSIALNGDSSKISKESEGVYSFLMPDTSAVITTTVDVEGECIVTGDVAAILEPQGDGTFKGRVPCERDSLVDIKLGSVSYSFVNVDHDHSFGYYESAYGASNAFRLAGNAIYEITVDPSAEKPVTIVRVGVFHAPTSVKELETLFNGDFAGRGLLDGGAFAVPGLSSVSYKNNVSGIQYDWSLYEKGSYATARSLLDEDDVSYDVRALEGNTYKVVDTYVEAVKDSEGRYFDDSVRTDTVAYSGTYAVESVIDEDNDALQRYKRSASRAASEIAMPSHNLYSLSREICFGYRVGFTVEDDLVASRVAITPTEKEDGGFGVEVYSWKNYDPNASTYADATKVERFEYRISLSFHADSTLASGSYLENYYDETTWTFNNSDTENGGSPKANTKPVVKRKSSFSYGYDAPKAGAPDFDWTPYFTTSISNLSAKSKDMADNVIQLGAVIDEAHDHDDLPVEENGISGYTSLLKFDVSPSTALDKWQLGIVGSSNESVIGRGANRSYCWNALSQGQSTVTIGNHIGSELATLDLTVSNNVKVQGYFVWAPSDVDESVVPNSSNVKMYAGDKVSVYLWASPTNCDPAPMIASSDPDLKVTLSDSRVKPDAWNIASYPTYLMTLDATAISLTEQKSVTLTITDPFFDEERGSGSKITVTLMPGASSSTWPASVVGTTWTGNKAITDEKDVELGFNAGTTHCESSVSFTGEDYAVSGYKKAVLSATYQGQTRTYDVGYTYDPSSTKVFTFKANSYDVTVTSSVDKEKGAFGLIYVVSTWAGGDDIEEDDIVGYPEDDYGPAAYQWFTFA